MKPNNRLSPQLGQTLRIRLPLRRTSPNHRKCGRREFHRLAPGRQQAAPIRVSDHLGHRLTELHPETLKTNLRRTRRGHCQLSRAVLTKLIRKQVLEIAQNRKKKNSSSSSMQPPSSGFKSWPSCTLSLSFREAPSQSCPSFWPAGITSSTSP
ncbi:hypothetical protein DFAR_3740006 [Desulfarculales bacterium]